MSAGAVKQEERRKWLEKIENLLAAAEIYRDVEKRAIGKIKEMLSEKGLRISEPEKREEGHLCRR